MAYRFTPADRGAFKRCRRQWDLGARERQNWEPARPAAVPDLDLAVRDALAVYYFPGMWDWQRSVVLPLVLQGFARSMGRQPGAGGGELAAGEGLLRRYFDWAPGVDRFSPVQVECAFEVNLPDPAGGDRELVLADGRPIRYQGRADLLAGDEHDHYWIVAHRVVDRFGPADELLLDEELVAACWAMERLYPGMRVAGTVHNELRRPRPANLPVGMDQPPPKAAPRRFRRRSRHQRGLPQHEASGGGRSLPYARRGVAQPGPPDADAVASQGDGEFRRTRVRRDRAELQAMGPGWPPRPSRWSTRDCRCTRARPRSTAGPASSWARAWPWSAAATSGSCSRPASATGARSGWSRAASAPPPGAWAGARPRPGDSR
jgi:hypothetical protein